MRALKFQFPLWITTLVITCLVSIDAVADPMDTLSFAQSILVARRDFNVHFIQTLSDPKMSAQEKREFIEGYLGFAPDSRISFPMIIQGIAPYVRLYESLLSVTINGHRSSPVLFPYLNQLENILYLDKPPSLQEQTIATLEMLYQEIWKSQQDELAARKSDLKQGVNRSQHEIEEKSGYSEIPFFKELLELLAQDCNRYWSQTVSYFRRETFANRDELTDYIKRDFPRSWKREEIQQASGIGGEEEGRTWWIFRNQILNLIDPVQKRMEALKDLVRKTNIHETETDLSQPIYSDVVRIRSFIETNLAKWNALMKLSQDQKQAIYDRASPLTMDDRGILSAYMNTEFPLLISNFLIQLDQSLDELEEPAARVRKFCRACKKRPKKKFSSSQETQTRPTLQEAPLSEIAKAPASESETGSTELAAGLSPADGGTGPTAPTTPTDQDMELKLELEIFGRKSIRGDLTSEPRVKPVEPPHKAPKESQASWLQSIFGHASRARVFETFFNDEINHQSLTFEEVENLVKSVGGKINQNGTSHCRVVVPGGFSFAVRPHGKSHSQKLSRAHLKSFRRAFEMADITPSSILAH